MFKFCNKFAATLSLQYTGRFSTSAGTKSRWDLITAVCLERKPVIAAPLTKLEEEYQKYLSEVEFEKSLKSDHEMQHEREMKQLEQLKKGEDVEMLLKETAQDFVDANTEELSQFEFASKITEADRKNDLKSLNRKLDKHLVLVVRQKIGNDHFYLLPQAERGDGETLRQTAERVIKDTCGKDLKALIYGNAPFSFYKYKYPSSVREQKGSVGAKVFIYFARYQKGNVGNTNVDYKWLDRIELKKSLPSEYGSTVSQMLIDE